MQVVERAEIIGRSFGDNNVVVVYNQFTEEKLSVTNPKGISIEMGEVYFLTIDSTSNQIVNAEVVSADAMVIEAQMAN
jgi:hypothetical protein